MNITYKKISELKPYKNNAKKHPKDQVERIAESIRQFGFTQPVLIDKDNIVVAGHGRILGAKKAGLKEIPTVCMDDLTEEQIKAYRLIDNKLNESEWDFMLLEQEIKGILTDEIDFTFYGFVDDIVSYSSTKKKTGEYKHKHFLVTFEKEDETNIQKFKRFLNDEGLSYAESQN